MLKKIVWVLLIIIVPFVVFELIALMPGAIEVAQTGMCPAAPTDIPPYPCTVGEYLNRMLFGGFAMIGHMMVLCSWSAVVFVGVIIWAVVRFVQRGKTPPAVNS
ncbi:MAG: hypothetical protein KDE51_00820 [Anaerolineales bacterium]|nr:hypothetical protein [Anaerolineales bacterium]